MKSSIIRSSIAALALCSDAVLGAQTVEQIVANINTLTTKSQALQEPAESLTTVNGPLLVIGQGPLPGIINGFQEIVTIATNDINQMQGTEAITETADQDAVYDAFRDFVGVHQKVITTLTDKSGVFSTAPFVGQPISAILRADESVTDTLTFTLIDLLSARAADIQSQGESLSNSIGTCIDKYDGLSLSK